MKASAFEFRFRFPIIVAICVIGLVAPWDFWLHLDTIRTWQWLAARVSRLGWAGFSGATDAVLMAGIVVALAAALLRTWGSAYVGNAVEGSSLRGDEAVAAGPCRWIRNSLYVGTFLNVMAVALLMPPSGAVFTIVALAVFEWRLIGAAAPSAGRPRWLAGFMREIYFWGVVVSFAALGWRYNAGLVLQGVIVSLGVSIVMRQFLPER